MSPALLPDAVGQAREQVQRDPCARQHPRQLVDVVETGTNLAAINAGGYFGASGLIAVEDAQLAAEKAYC